MNTGVPTKPVLPPEDGSVLVKIFSRRYRGCKSYKEGPVVLSEGPHHPAAIILTELTA